MSISGWYLDKPKVSLSLGTSIEMNNIREGEDIYLECLVDSRPPVTKFYYTHKVGDSESNFFQMHTSDIGDHFFSSNCQIMHKKKVI